jgi:hypothetical protein
MEAAHLSFNLMTNFLFSTWGINELLIVRDNQESGPL